MDHPDHYILTWREYTMEIPGDYPMPWPGDSLWINYFHFLPEGFIREQFAKDLGPDRLNVRKIDGNHYKLIHTDEFTDEDLKAGFCILLDEFVDFELLNAYWEKHPETYPKYLLG